MDRYRAALSRPAEPAPTQGDGPAPTGGGEQVPTGGDEQAGAAQPARSPRRRAGVLIVGAVAAAALIAAVPLVRPSGTPAPGPTAEPIASGPLRVTEAASARFARALAASEPPRVAQWLLLHPAERPAAMAAATRTIVDEQQGGGTATVTLHPDLAAGSGGRVTVVLTTDRAVPVRWSVRRTAVRQDHRQYDQVVGQRLQRTRPGVPQAATVRYDGAAPSTLVVEADAGTHWDAVVAFTD